MTEQTKPCYCGGIPETLLLMSITSELAYATGDCCCERVVEFQTDSHPLDSDECRALAITAWNETLRKEQGE